MRVAAGDTPPSEFDAARRVAAGAVREGLLPCAVFGVTDAHGTIAIHAVSGRDRDVDERTIFFLASVTKPIVATAIMRYVDEGRLDLHRPLASYLPDAGSGLAGVTAWHVLTHTSGVPDTSIERLVRERPTYKRMLQHRADVDPRLPARVPVPLRVRLVDAARRGHGGAVRHALQ